MRASTSTAAVHLVIEGRVQGVGFRFWTERVCRELDLRGWVRNLGTGDVEVYAEGDDQALAELVRQCHRGPRSALVERVLERRLSPLGKTTFEIKETAAGPSDPLP